MKEPIFEEQDDRERELNAVTKFCSLFPKYVFEKNENKLTKYPKVDYKIFKEKENNEKILMLFAEVKGRKKYGIFEGEYFMVSMRKLANIINQKNPTFIWACTDGIVFGQVKKIFGYIEWGGRINEREGSIYDREMMIYYPRQENLKYAYFHSTEYDSLI